MGGEAPRQRRSRLARSFELAPLVAVLLIATTYAVTAPEPAIDTWTSLAAGRHIAAHGVSQVDPFCFQSRRPAGVSSDQAPAWFEAIRTWAVPDGWINQAWAANLLMFAVFSGGGIEALLVLKWLAYLGVGTLLIAHARVRGAGLTLAFACASLALIVCRSFLQTRAQMFTDLFAVAFLFALTLAGRKDGRRSWVMVALVAAWSNLHGGFVFALIMLGIAAAVAFAAFAFDRQRRAATGREAARLGAILASAVVAAVVASPNRLSNLLHPLEVTVGETGAEWRKVEEWHSLFGSGSLQDQATWVGVAVLALVTALGAWRYSRHSERALPHPRQTAATDLLMLAVALAMALQSLRFVPLACFVAAPLVASWGDQSFALVGRNQGAPAGSRRPWRGTTLRWVGACLLGLWLLPPFVRWASRPWPADARRVAVAERLLQTYDRPWDACAFLRENEVHGRIWNLWEEGGFLSWCQQPDGKTGRPPLQVAIDGRAQQAFDVAASREYGVLLDGGPESAAMVASGSRPSPPTVRAGVLWFDHRLRQLDTAIAHVPEQWSRSFPAVALMSLSAWRVVYADERHSILVDTRHPEGRALADALESGMLRFETPAAELLARALNYLHDGTPESDRRAAEMAKRAYAAAPSARAVGVIATAGRTGHAVEGDAFCHEVADEYLATREHLITANGFAQRTAAARAALEHLAARARQRGNDGELRRTMEQLAVIAPDEALAESASAW